MTTDTATPMPQVNLDRSAAEKRSLTDVYRLQSAAYEYASDDYAAKANGARPLQLGLNWEGLTFRFSDNPTTNPVLKRSINVTDKNNAVMNWGDPANPEPTAEDSFPIQMSKHFAKCGVELGTDPHVLDGLVFRCERRTIRAGKSEITTLVPLEQLPKDFAIAEADIRIVSPREQGQAGNPAGTTTAVASGPTKDVAYAALASAMAGKNKTDMISVAVNDPVAKENSDVLGEIATGKAVEALAPFGSFDDAGVFTPTA